MEVRIITARTPEGLTDMINISLRAGWRMEGDLLCFESNGISELCHMMAHNIIGEV